MFLWLGSTHFSTRTNVNCRNGYSPSCNSDRKWLEKNEETQDREEESESRRVPMARLYMLFNVHQCELPERLQPFLQIDNALGADTHRRIEACEQIIATMPNRPALRHGEARAYYQPLHDMVNMPERRLFPKA